MYKMLNFEATVKINGVYTVVRVQAEGIQQATRQLEGLYGKGSIVHLPRQI